MQFIGLMKNFRRTLLAIMLAGFTALAACGPTGEKTASVDCPEGLGWAEGLAANADSSAKLPVTMSATADDCLIQQWSWEAFVWATGEVNGKPRFMSFKTMEMLAQENEPTGSDVLRLSPRSTKAHSLPTEEYAAAFMEADGSMLVAQNGYPVYASVHMNDSYFETAKANLIVTGDYQKNADADTPSNDSADCGEMGDTATSNNAYFQCGAAVFKATWLRLNKKSDAPEGTYVTKAEVPVLENKCDSFGACTAVATDETVTVDVALVGLHVAGYVQHHPEFLWATFEHNKNAPSFADGTFSWDDEGEACGAGYTFCAEGTPITKKTVLVANQPNNANDAPLLSFDEITQTFSPITQVVQMNRTGGDTQPNGPANIEAINTASQGALKTANSQFADYFLVGTVWLKPDSYTADNPNITSRTYKWQDDAMGAVALANTTAETFMQAPGTSDRMNCFDCHNPQSYSYQGKEMPLRRIAMSHVLAVDTPFAVPNQAATKPSSGYPDDDAETKDAN